uniref:Putative secreted protein n=1 Tax=Lutzomyia longipalpis TaxID=7200 RepID=A0A1B0CM20_LUTLO
MKCIVIVLILLCSQSLAQYTTFHYRQKVEGQHLLGYDFGTTNTTETSESHEVVLRFSTPLGTRITQIHGNVYPSWTFLEHPAVLQHEFYFLVGNKNATFMWADMYVFGFPPNP